jgi:broad specificity phosphatase PhoE
MGNIYIIRHGRTEWNINGRLQGRLNSPLLEASIPVIKAIAAFLSDKQIEKVYTSPLKRSVETAQMICDTLGTGYLADERLVECDHGCCEGKRLADCMDAMPGFFAQREKDKWNVAWPEGESYADVYRRAKSFLSDIDTTKNVLIIAHETLNKCMIGALLGWADSDIISFKQPNCEICMIENENFVVKNIDG